MQVYCTQLLFTKKAGKGGKQNIVLEEVLVYRYIYCRLVI